MNICHFIGNLTRDPEVRAVGSGDKKVANFSIAINRSYNSGGERKTETTFLDIEAWDRQAEIISEHFAKGDAIVVHGSLKQDSWTDKTTNENRTKIKLRLENFEFLPTGKKKKEKEEKSNDVDPNYNNDGNIPF